MMMLKRTAFALFIGLIVLLLVSHQQVNVASAKGNPIPLKGRFDGVGATFSGHITHLGKFEGVIDNTTTPANAIWTAANGDTVSNKTVTFEIHFDQPVAPNTYRYTQTLEITGGTGRFAHTTGKATVTGTINVVTFEYDGHLDGYLSRGKEQTS